MLMPAYAIRARQRAPYATPWRAAGARASYYYGDEEERVERALLRGR